MQWTGHHRRCRRGVCPEPDHSVRARPSSWSFEARIMLILGLNMFHADASAAIVQDGEIVFAIAEERLNRIKHYAGFPRLAIKACLNTAGAEITDVDHVAIGQDSDANLARKV